MDKNEIKIALFTDTVCDANGVSRFLQDMSKEALKKDIKLNILSSTVKTYCDSLNNLHIFKPFFKIKMPFYKELDLVIPPAFKMAKKFKELNPDVVHISTPGIIGLTGLLIAIRYKKPVLGTYHTDFPEYLYKNTNSRIVKKITAFYMRLFYKRFKALATRSKDYIQNIQNTVKLEPKNIFVLTPGTNIKTFDPKYKDETLWERYNLNPQFKKYLYVGRLTKEKNVDLLFDIWEKFYLKSSLKQSYLIMVGSGELEKHKERLKNYNIIFLGHKQKSELSSLYASSNIFLFPSTTDTLGQVILEAMASGTPVIVTDKGGPCEIVKGSPNDIGSIIDIKDESKWIDTLCKIENGTTDIDKQSINSFEYAQNFSITNTFESFMEFHLNFKDFKQR